MRKPGRRLVVSVIVSTSLVAAAAAGFFAYGRERLWLDMAGPADLGPYDFSKPIRTGHPNDALACPVGAPVCALASPEAETPLFQVDAGTLHEAARAALAALGRSVIVADDPVEGTLRAVVRTRILAMPDTVSILTRPEGLGRSSLWIYSRSQVGHSDLGTNARRVARLVRRFARDLPKALDPAADPPA